MIRASELCPTENHLLILLQKELEIERMKYSAKPIANMKYSPVLKK
jgi:hypothetical protein